MIIEGVMDDKRLFSAKVLSNITLGSVYYRITFQLDRSGSEAFADSVPGQFAELDLSCVAIPSDHDIPQDLQANAKRQIILRRPFSFSDISIDGNNVHIDMVYCVLGPATVRMTTLQKGDSVTLIGPLGKGFTFDNSRKYALLVAGGMGAPPMQHLATYFEENHPQMQVVAFAGAKSRNDLPFTVCDTENGLELEEYSTCEESYIATDDGSAGHKGFISECVEECLAQNTKDGQPPCPGIKYSNSLNGHRIDFICFNCRLI